MKFLKLYENVGKMVWVLHAENVIDGPRSFVSYEKVFETKQDAINYLINDCNDIQTDILNSNEYSEIVKKNYGHLILDDYVNCVNFIINLGEIFDDETGCSLNIIETLLESNVQIKEEYKIKIEAKKFGL